MLAGEGGGPYQDRAEAGPDPVRPAGPRGGGRRGRRATGWLIGRDRHGPGLLASFGVRLRASLRTGHRAGFLAAPWAGGRLRVEDRFLAARRRWPVLLFRPVYLLRLVSLFRPVFLLRSAGRAGSGRRAGAEQRDREEYRIRTGRRKGAADR